MRKFLKLSWADRWFLFTAAFWLIVVKIFLVTLPFQTVQRLIARFGCHSTFKVRRSKVKVPTTTPPSTFNVQRSTFDVPRSASCSARPALCSPLPSERIAWAVKAAARRLPGTTCLSQALVTQVLLGRCDHPANVHVGVTKGQDGQFEAHAWVESKGRIVIGGADVSRYKPILILEGPKA